MTALAAAAATATVMMKPEKRSSMIVSFPSFRASRWQLIIERYTNFRRLRIGGRDGRNWRSLLLLRGANSGAIGGEPDSSRTSSIRCDRPDLKLPGCQGRRHSPLFQ